MMSQKKLPPCGLDAERGTRVDFKTLSLELLGSEKQLSTHDHHLVGINSLGLGGTNVHCVIQGLPSEPEPSKKLPYLLSFRKDSWANKELKLAKDCLEQNSRPGNLFRRHQYLRSKGFIWGQSKKELLEKLRSVNLSSQFQCPAERKLAFVFPGPGSQYKNMGRELYESFPIFKQAIDRCHQILSDRYKFDLLDFLYGSTCESEMHTIQASQPIVFSFSYALSKLYEGMDLRPDVVLGHSAGEYAAAVCAGMISLEDGFDLIYHRGFGDGGRPERWNGCHSLSG